MSAEEAKAELDRIFLDATDDLPDDVSDGIDAILARPDVLLAALGIERVGESLLVLRVPPGGTS